MYKGAKYLGKKTIAMKNQTVKYNDIVAIMPEQEAIKRKGFEPVYSDNEIKTEKLKKERTNERR